MRDVAIEAGFNSVLVVPLVDQTGILGSLVVLRQNAGEFSANLIGLMKTFAHQAVLAMRNARLFTEVDHKSRELLAANDIVREQADKLQEQTDQLKDWNQSLEERVETQLGEIERIRRLERFLAPQVAQLIASSDGHEGLLDSHRREVTVVFCDLRGFTAFTETTEPEEAMNVLREYHAALGELIFKYEGTLDRYAGDGVMILFNAPIQFDDHTARAVRMAVEMRDTIGGLTDKWRNRGHNLGFGIGIALGYATLGQIGFEQRLEYAAIGSVTNLASRLCDEAKANQIVVSRRVYGMVEPWVEGKPIDDLNLKGFNHPILAAEILSWREEVDNVVDAASAAARMKNAVRSFVGWAKRSVPTMQRRAGRDGGHAALCPPYGSALDFKQPSQPSSCRRDVRRSTGSKRIFDASRLADMQPTTRTQPARPSVPAGLLHSRAGLRQFFEPALDLGAGHREILELAVVEPVQGYARGVTLVARDHRREEAVDRDGARRASQTAFASANGLVAEVGMVVSIVMAIFFQRVAGTR